MKDLRKKVTVSQDVLLIMSFDFVLVSRPSSMTLPASDNVEELVNACLDTSGIDRRYSAIIMEELRDCTNLTPDQMRQAAQEITSTFGSNSPQYASFTSSIYDSVATRVTSSDERLFDSSNPPHSTV